MNPLTTSHPASAETGGSGAYLQAALDAVIVADASGCVVEFNPAAEQIFGYIREEALGRTLAELIVPPSLRERHSRAFARFVETGEERLFGRRLELTGMRADGSEFPVELALSRVEGEPPLICGAIRDLSEAKRTEDDLRRLVAEQAALRRVATLVARGATLAEVFAALAEEAARILDVPLIETARYEPDGTATVIGAWGEQPFPIGSNWTLDGPSVTASVLHTGRPARIDDYSNLSGTIAEIAQKAGFRSAVGVPIVVNGRTWGTIYAVSTEPKPLPPDTEERLADFTELVGTAIANTEARDDLRQSDELYRKTIAQAGAVPYLYDYAEDRYTFIGEGIEELTGYSAAEFTPNAWGGLVEETILLGDQAGLTNDEAVRRTRSGEFPRWRCDQRITTRNGESRWVSDASVEILGRDGRSIGAVGILQDITERKRTEEEAGRLADEQAALRRVATLVAEQASPTEVFSAVAKEVAQVLNVPLTAVVRYGPERVATQVGVWGRENPFPLGTSWTLDDRSVSGLVFRTGRAARVNDYAEVPGPISTALAREAGIGTAVGVPILVDGSAWGVMMALSTERKELPADTEARLAAFTELIATAISNIQARDDLHGLADEQAALRRVATLVARGTDSAAVFEAVCAEMGELIGATGVNLVHFTPDGFNVTMAGWSVCDTHVPTGTRLPIGADTINGLIHRTVAPARFDSYEESSSELAAVIRQCGIRSEVGAPVIGGELGLARQVVDEVVRLHLGQRLKQDRRGVQLAAAPVRSPFEELRACETNEKDRTIPRPVSEVIDEVEEQLLAPVDVIEGEHDGPRAGDRLEEAAHGPKGLLGRDRVVAESDCGGDPLGDRLRLRIIPEHLNNPALGLIERRRPPDRRGRAYDIGERPESNSLAVREAAAKQHRSLAFGLRQQFAYEPRLSHPRGTQDVEEVAGPNRRRSAERLAKQSEFTPAPHERRVEPALERRCLGEHTEQPPSRGRLGLALQREVLDGLNERSVPDESVRRVADQDLARGGRLLEPLGDDDCFAGNEVLVGRGLAGDDLARADAGAHRELGTVLALEALVERGQYPAQLDRRPNSPQCVVFVCARDSKDCHDCVANELLDGAAVAFDHGPRLREVCRLDASQRLGVKPLAE
jgi:PAS domain S-box-containing protein